MKGAALETPVALLIFNRPDTTQQVFDAIAQARPSRLLVVADGPRHNRPGEAEKVEATRAVIEQVDWTCEVTTNFADDNLGCKRRVSSGLDWVFSTVGEAIILEDDCLPDSSFFSFCEELLDRYRDDLRISQIDGVNFQRGCRLNDDSYYLSKYSYVWGWASWANRWRGTFDASLGRWPEIRDSGRAGDLVGDESEADHWTRVFDSVHRGEIDTWDYQWFHACMAAGRSSIVPNVNLVSNIGFRPDATHTVQDAIAANMPTQPMLFPLRHPAEMFQSRQLDKRYFERFASVSLKRRVLNRIDRLMTRWSSV